MKLLRTFGPAGIVRRAASGNPIFLATSSEVDRCGDIVEASGCDWAHFKRNPVILFGHDHMQPVARGVSVERDRERDGWLVEVEFPPQGTSAASDEARGLVEQGIVRACSIGFRPKSQRAPNKSEKARGADGRVFTAVEVLELSLVAIPAHAGALRVKSSNAGNGVGAAPVLSRAWPPSLRERIRAGIAGRLSER